MAAYLLNAWLIAAGWVCAAGCGDAAPESRLAASRPQAEPPLATQLAEIESGVRHELRLGGDKPWRDDDLAPIEAMSPQAAARVTALHVESSALTDAGLARLGGLKNLEVLKVRGGAFSAEGWRALVAFPALRVLNLPGVAVDDEALRAWSAAPRLELLRCGGTGVTAAGLAHLPRYPSLRFLHLLEARLGPAELAELRRLRGLESLYLDGVSLAESDVRALLAALPDVHFHLNNEHADHDPRKHPH